GIGQLPLGFEELTAALAEAQRQVELLPGIEAQVVPKGKPVRRKQLPEHFERIHEIIEPKDCACPECGVSLGELGTDEAEVLEVKTVTFTVKRYIRNRPGIPSCAGSRDLICAQLSWDRQGLPAVWQKLVDATGRVSRQTLEHILEITVRLVSV